ETSDRRDSGRGQYTSGSDADALEGFDTGSRLEGILPALETAHAIVEAMQVAARRAKDDVVVTCFSGRGDKDCFEVARLRGEEIWMEGTIMPLSNCAIVVERLGDKH